MSIGLDVVPFYLTWFILCLIFLKDDRKKAKVVLMAVCIMMGGFEALTMMNYGDPDYERVFNGLVEYFPSHFTMHENLKLVRSMFPALV